MRVPIAVLAPLLLLGAACGRDSADDVVRQNEACARLLGADIPADDRDGDVQFRCAVPILSVESIAGSLEHYVEGDSVLYRNRTDLAAAEELDSVNTIARSTVRRVAFGPAPW